jgi:thiol-disulfide isomerase/thioredoxin
MRPPKQIIGASAFFILSITPLMSWTADTQDSAANSDVLTKVNSIWNSELKNDRGGEMKLAQEVAAGSGPDWVDAWARGVVYRLTSQGKPIEMAFISTDGRDVDLRKMKGHVVLIDFWATWCAPCVDALPELKQTYSHYHTEGLEVFGVSWDSDRAKLDSFVTENKMAWPQFFDGQKPGKWGVAFGIGGVPYTLIVDKSGRLRFFGAAFDHATLDEHITRLLAESL